MQHGKTMRALTTQDATELAQLEIRLFPDNCLNETTLRNEISRGVGWAILDNQGQLAGYALGVFSEASQLFDLLRLGVVPGHRRQGHGRALLRAATTSFPRCMLTVAAENQAARTLYHNEGFKLLGVLPSGALLLWVTSSTPAGTASR